MPAQTFTREERSAYLGASDIATIFGMSKFRNVMDLVREKKGLPSLERKVENPALVWGTHLEDFVAEMAEKELGLKLRRDNKRGVHPRLPYLSCQYDRAIQGRPELRVEIKTTTYRSYQSWPDEQFGIPNSYYLQVQTQMACNPRLTQVLLVAAVLDTRKLQYHYIDRNEEVIAAIEEEAEYFWEKCVKGDELPRNMQVADYRDPHFIREGSKMASAKYMDLLKAFAEATAFQKKNDELLEALKREMMAEMGTSEEIVNEQEVWLSRLKPYTYKKLDTKRLKAERPDIYEEYVEVQPEKLTMRMNHKMLSLFSNETQENKFNFVN